MLKHSVSNKKFECGTDEAGRGCLAGPVAAAAVILPKHFKNDLLNDSKQLSHAQRYKLRPIIEKEAISYAVAYVYPSEIDKTATNMLSDLKDLVQFFNSEKEK